MLKTKRGDLGAAGTSRGPLSAPTGPALPILIKPTAAYQMYVSHAQLSRIKMFAKVSHPVLKVKWKVNLKN